MIDNHEPLAITGMACRFPGGANTPESFWQLLAKGTTAITEIPTDRFDVDAYSDPVPATPGKVMSRWGGFLDHIDQFDARFFGISPREADVLDPQQRLLLEAAWEALDDAGQTRVNLLGSQTGVFVGMWINDYEARLFSDPARAEFYMTTGSGRYAASGRLSYTFGFQGPSLTIDTACSSSLVAVHYAVQSLRRGECDLAVVGAANIILQPQITIAYSQSRMMATDGRCKFGDASANGYVRSEGVGVIVLKRLSQAQRDYDRVHALIVGSAVNNDGRSSGFLTTPGRAGQEEVLRKAYMDAGVSPGRVQYVEAHGTGTSAGDPVEIGALGAILSIDRPPDRPCLIGSVKTNIGHTEGAAGLAGLMKVVLSMQHRQIPASLHVKDLTPKVPWTTLPVRIQRELGPWPVSEGPLIAGVSAFGIAGTNAHVVLEEAPPPSGAIRAAERLPYILPLSAHTPEAVTELARAYQTFLVKDSAALADICYTASVRRGHHDRRLAVIGRAREELALQLEAASKGESPIGHKPESRLPGIAFVCPGQGSQWPGMGRQLFEHVPVFREVIERCDKAMRPLVDWSLIEQLLSAEARLTEIDVIQPMLCAIEIALAAVWRSWGIEPAAVVGHSMGEVAAACIAGALDLDAAMLIICTRSRLMKRVSGCGAMAVVNLSSDQAQATIHGYEDRLSVAVSNGPESSVLSGDPTALETVLEALRSKDIFCRLVQVDVAAHSPHMDALRSELESTLRTLQPQASRVPIYSTVTGRLIDGEALDAVYWSRNLREPVLFSTVMQQSIDAGVTTFIELSPHPILLAAIEQSLQARQQAGLTLLSLRRDDDEPMAMLSSLAGLYTHGYDVDWSRLFPQGKVVSLPAYPWQRERFWFQTSASSSTTQRSRGVKQAHPLLGWQLDLADLSGRFVWEAELSRRTLPHLYDHRLNGTPLLAASAYTEIAAAAGRAAFTDRPFTFKDVSFKRALPLGDERILLQMSLSPAANGGGLFTVHSRLSDAWTLHFSAVAHSDANVAVIPIDPLDTIQARADREMSGEDAYRDLEATGIQIGPTLKGMVHLWRGNNEVLARLAAPVINGPYLVAPAVLDSLFQLVGFVAGDQSILMPDQAEALRFSMEQPADSELWGYLRIRSADSHYSYVDLSLLDLEGHSLVEIAGLRLKQFGAVHGVSDNVDDWLYEVKWVSSPKSEAPRDAAKPDGTRAWLIFADQSGVSDALAAVLAERGERSILISSGDDVRRVFEQVKDFRGIVYLSGLDVHETEVLNCDPVLYIVRELTRHDWPVPPRLWLITRHAQMAEQTTNVAQSPLWGLGRVIAAEHREHWGGLIDLDRASSPAESAACLVAEMLQPDGDDQVVYRSDQRYAARLARVQNQRTAFEQTRLRPEAAYLITGGFGGIGVEVTRWLVQQGARRLILMGRTPLPARAEWNQVRNDRQRRMIEALRDLEALGVSVQYAAVDVADEDQLRAFLSQYRLEGWPPIRGIIHAAGVIDDRLVAQLDAESWRAVLRPKVAGGWLLHRLFEDQPLDFFVMFSSIGSLIGQVGQGSYAAANAFLDALAHYRRACGLPALSINWGAWTGLGFAATTGGQQVIDQLEAQGLAGFSAKQGLEALSRLLSSEATQAVVLPIDWTRLRQSPASTNRLLSDLIEKTPEPAPTNVPEKSLRDTLCELAPAQRRAALEAYLQNTLAQVLRLTPGRIEPDMPFGRLGLESLMAVEFRNRLATGLDLNLSATLAWNYPTITELAKFLDGKLEPIGPDKPIGPVPDAPQVDHTVAAIEAMSDDEALQALRRRKGKR